jgi:glycosyltransferase involved in cell wall biosynthesis
MKASRSHQISTKGDRPKVAVVYPIAFGEGGIFGGGERYAIELAKALAQKTPTRFITFGDQPRREMIDDLDIRICKPMTHLHGQRTNPVSFGFLKHLVDADVIHCTFWNSLMTDFAAVTGELLRKKVFVTDVGGGGSISLQRWLPVNRTVDGFLLIAEQGGGAFKDYRSKWSTIYAGIDVERYKPDPEAKRRGVVFVGRLLPHKGINYLIEGIDHDVPLTIVGRPYHQQYFELLQSLAADKKVTFVTDASDEQVVRFYQSSEVMVFPSVNDTIYGDHTDLPELLGFTAMEAMACGTPVICSDVGAMSEVVIDCVTGHLIPPNDPAAIREKLRLLIGSPGLAAKFGEAGRQRILELFTWDRVAERCLAAYTN